MADKKPPQRPGWSVDPPQTIEQMWSCIDSFVSRQSVSDRHKTRRVLIRRLMHPEGARIGSLPESWIHPKQGEGPMPRVDSPICMSCGQASSRHDPMNGESDSCNGLMLEPRYR